MCGSFVRQEKNGIITYDCGIVIDLNLQNVLCSVENTAAADRSFINKLLIGIFGKETLENSSLCGLRPDNPKVHAARLEVAQCKS